MDVGILPPCFPKPMTSPPSLIDPIRCDAAHSKPRLSEVDLSEKQKTKTNSNYPRTPSFSPTRENVPKLKEWLLERVATTVFNSRGKFPAMSGPPAHIHLKEGSTPKARHNPIPDAFIRKEKPEDANSSGSYWRSVKLKVAVSWTRSLLMRRRVVTVTSWNEKLDLFHNRTFLTNAPWKILLLKVNA